MCFNYAHNLIGTFPTLCILYFGVLDFKESLKRAYFSARTLQCVNIPTRGRCSYVYYFHTSVIQHPDELYDRECEKITPVSPSFVFNALPINARALRNWFCMIYNLFLLLWFCCFLGNLYNI